MIYLISDTHFRHKNIINYCNRPFTSVEEMDEVLIENWNRVVKPSDEVYHLGDVSFGTNKENDVILKRLNGHKHLIKGNHDNYVKQNLHLFESVQDYKRLKAYGHVFVLSHYPMLSWHGSHKGALHVHGHTHSTIDHLNEGTTRIDVGVDGHNFTPVSLDYIIEKLSNINYSTPDKP